MVQLAVVGWPVAHSLSPAMHQAALQTIGLGWDYQAFAVAPADLPEWIATAAERGYVGINLTQPHKVAALTLCSPDLVAAEVGAVNTLRFRPNGHVAGFNTDVYGFEMALRELALSPRRAALLGAGGAARAVARALVLRGCEVTLVSRSQRRAQPELHHIPWSPSALAALLVSVDLLVDATSRGRNANLPPIDLSPLAPTAAVVDLTVRPTTPLITAARTRGLVAATGEIMLLHQGAQAFELWTGRTAPLEVMRAALASALFK